MNELPKRCLIDTNVPISANYALSPDLDGSMPPPDCIEACVSAIEHVTQKGGLVIDCNDEIFTEYRKNLSLGGQPGLGDFFVKWVKDNQWTSSFVTRVPITKNGDSYDEFPQHDGLKDFDHADRKFVAVSNACTDKPPILQATDSKWWGWRKALAEVGIGVRFLCPGYVRGKHKRKMG